MTDTPQKLMRDAARLTRDGRLDEATETIQRALRGNVKSVAATAARKTKSGRKSAAVTLDASASVSGRKMFEIDTRDYDAAEADFAAAESAHHDGLQTARGDVFRNRPTETHDTSTVGEFLGGTHTHAAKTLRFKLYVPSNHVGRALPLVVMLHAGSQDADDFAAGTGMNEAAHQQNFFVLYPEQSLSNNASQCWNWFQPEDQQRNSGEPALIATMTKAIIKKYRIDPRRVYIAGLSAGGAMATIVAEAYPEIFAAVGVHSGLARGAASNVMEAFTVMQSGDTSRAEHVAGINMKVSVPTIVFHGDQDQTVHPRNGEQVIAAVLREEADAKVERGVSPKGRRYTRSRHVDKKGKRLAEHWLVHGAGHAWSGGDAAGSFTDASGPDATREMLRFFFAQ
ncbi:MAG: PHB depolymerase family esterase [Betaproteobacteria bacterium]